MKKLNSELSKYQKNNFEKDLQKNYRDAKKDEVFEKLVSVLNVDEKKLINYTSTIEDCVIEHKNCFDCKNLMACKNEIIGYAYTPIMVDENLEFAYMACRFQKKMLKDTDYLKNVFHLQMANNLKTAQMKDIYKDDERYEVISWLTKFIKDYPNNKKGLYLHGSFGSGKTFLVVALFNELAKKNIKSAVVYWPEFLRNLKASFDSNFNEKFELVKTAPLLLLDDIGAENITDWGRDEILGPILQYRMENDLLTFLTSNFGIKELEEHLSHSKDKVSLLKARRIIERIKYLTEEKKLVGENKRS